MAHVNQKRGIICALSEGDVLPSISEWHCVGAGPDSRAETRTEQGSRIPGNIVKIYLSQCSSSSTVKQSRSHWECRTYSRKLNSPVKRGWMPAYTEQAYNNLSLMEDGAFLRGFTMHIYDELEDIFIFIPWLPPEPVKIFLYLRPCIYPPPQFLFST